jgi:integrase
MRIFRRGKQGIYWAQYRNKRFSLHTNDRKAAELAFREYQRRAALPSYQGAHEATLSDALADYIDHARDINERAAGTLRMLELHARHLCTTLGASRALATLDAAAVDDYAAARRRQGASRSTIHKERSTLRGALKLAARHGRFHAPIESLFAPYAIEYKPLDRHLTLPQVDALIAALPEPRAAVVAFIVATAADWGSVALATAADFDQGSIVVHGTKTKARRRVVPVLSIFRKLAARARAWLDAHDHFEPWGSVRRDLDAACERLGFGHMSPRDLRRTTATALRAAGVAPPLIASVLGHRDSRMVEAVYGRMPADALGPAIERELARSRPKPGKRSRRC